MQVGGKPVIQACNLLSLNDLRDFGIKVGSRPDPNVVNFKRDYLVGDGNGPLKTSFPSCSQADGEAPTHRDRRP
ncbi:hypothetical protein QRX50_03370 [Amycolatopsis carbonis]|uniref:Uncharacterized protein n=1 Tax=Amycolatopsis carbonis TaxID=715471 RepID=A0A9Y2MYA0_9PSEU|nr:hypothetical protein [Amycolatopsis sp. 2-15]WIX79854.1 hypothetical protein QRX50_03370 [Amycolatopsis sp. 2-15]